MKKLLKKAERELEKEMLKEFDLLFPAAATILWRDFGFRRLRILRRFLTFQELWEECANHGVAKSMLQMLEEETGIEIRINGSDISYHSLAYLDSDAWNKKPPTLPQLIYIREQQKKWVNPQLVACMALALHRYDKWGTERLVRFITKMNEVRDDFGTYKEKYIELLKEVTGDCLGLYELKESMRKEIEKK